MIFSDLEQRQKDIVFRINSMQEEEIVRLKMKLKNERASNLKRNIHGMRENIHEKNYRDNNAGEIRRIEKMGVGKQCGKNI